MAGITRIAVKAVGVATLITLVDDGKKSTILCGVGTPHSTPAQAVTELTSRNGKPFSQTLSILERPDGKFRVAMGEIPEEW